MKDDLDILMGKDRNLTKQQKIEKKNHFSDQDVCKYSLVAFCPHDYFVNTRADLGRCDKRHDPSYKQQFLEDSDKLYYQKKYEQQTIQTFEKLVSIVDSKIKKALQRIELPMPDIERTVEQQERINQMNSLIERKLNEVEQLAEAGKLKESEMLMQEIEMMKQQREDQDSQICEICGAIQANTDGDKRQISHLEGRQHQGFSLVRSTLEELKSHVDMYAHIDLATYKLGKRKVISQKEVSPEKQQSKNQFSKNQTSQNGKKYQSSKTGLNERHAQDNQKRNNYRDQNSKSYKPEDQRIRKSHYTQDRQQTSDKPRRDKSGNRYRNERYDNKSNRQDKFGNSQRKSTRSRSRS